MFQNCVKYIQLTVLREKIAIVHFAAFVRIGVNRTKKNETLKLPINIFFCWDTHKY